MVSLSDLKRVSTSADVVSAMGTTRVGIVPATVSLWKGRLRGMCTVDVDSETNERHTASSDEGLPEV